MNILLDSSEDVDDEDPIEEPPPLPLPSNEKLSIIVSLILRTNTLFLYLSSNSGGSPHTPN
jgi:hypothetical protein